GECHTVIPQETGPPPIANGPILPPEVHAGACPDATVGPRRPAGAERRRTVQAHTPTEFLWVPEAQTAMTNRVSRRSGTFRAAAGLLLVFWSAAAGLAAAEAPRLTLHKGDRIIIIGNTLAERMQYFGHFETLLHSRFPDHELVVHNLGWSADELTLRPRQASFPDHGHRLEDEKPGVLIAAFGFNESFAGPQGLTKFRHDLDRFIRESTTIPYNGKQPPRLVLLA